MGTERKAGKDPALAMPYGGRRPKGVMSAAVSAFRRMYDRDALIPGSAIAMAPHLSSQAGRRVAVGSTPVLLMGEHMERQLRRAKRFLQSRAATKTLARVADMPHHIRCAASVLVAMEPSWAGMVWDSENLHPVKLA